MSLALRKATGKIVAFVDDDTQWPNEMILQYLVAAFEDPAVGGVTGRQNALIPVERRSASVITASEVMTMRALQGSGDSNAIMYAAEGTVVCLTGRTMVVKAEAVQTEEFHFALTHQTWKGKIINTGDDGFVTHWLLNHGWKLAFQNAPEAEIFTLTESGSRFAKQLVRWRRAGFRDAIIMLCLEPGFYRSFRRNPGYALNRTLFILKPLTTTLHLIAWSRCVYEWPRIA
jgi:cellulose synthase/poly-beta-1,6-N-acetylglucosamine synthase-like glycosyltransferase